MSLFDGKSTIPERKYIPSDSPPKSPRIRPARSVESTVDGEGRSVEEMRRIIRKVLIDNLPQVQEVRIIVGVFGIQSVHSNIRQSTSLSITQPPPLFIHHHYHDHYHHLH